MELFFPKASLDLIDGRQFLDNNGIAHQDLKPANILASKTLRKYHWRHRTNPVDTRHRFNVYKMSIRRRWHVL